MYVESKDTVRYIRTHVNATSVQYVLAVVQKPTFAVLSQRGQSYCWHSPCPGQDGDECNYDQTQIATTKSTPALRRRVHTNALILIKCALYSDGIDSAAST